MNGDVLYSFMLDLGGFLLATYALLLSGAGVIVFRNDLWASLSADGTEGIRACAAPANGRPPVVPSVE